MGLGSILLIDDNVVQAATRKAILERGGHSVVAVLDPGRALEQFAQDLFSNTIWLVITDHIMPGMSGSALVRELRKLRPTIPVIVISGLEDAEQEYEGLDVHFRMKPLNPEGLLASVAGLRLLVAGGSPSEQQGLSTL